MRRVGPELLSCALVTWVCLGVGCDTAKSGETTPPPTEPVPGTSESEPEPEGPPKLVVVVVIDQMRFDYFDRFGSQWQQGFAQLRAEGLFFDEVFHAHALTETAPGHATISTGTHPAHHGIVANEWLDRTTGKEVAAVADPSAQVLESPSAKGVSAATLLREGVGDWMQQADPASIVISVALKDRAAILMGGKRPDAAIWYDDRFGGYTTSTYYAEQLPAWVSAYNQRGRAEALYGAEGWVLSRPDDAYAGSRRETDPKLVSTFSDYSLTKQFPHVIAVEGKQPRNVIRDTPFGDLMTLELAREAIAAEGMGEDAVPDLLMVGLSAGDYAGHRYGPDSVEVHDYYLRLDEFLGQFVADLDQRLGDDYVLVLTSDHGVAPMPEYSDLETAGRFVDEVHLPALMKRAAKTTKLAKQQRPELVFTHGVDLRFDPAVDEATRAAYRAELAKLLRERDEVADAWTRDELLGAEDRNEFAAAWRMSFHPERSPDILIQYAPGVSGYPEGTGHGTPYEFDQHVPLVIRGLDRAGQHGERVLTVDIAPTIAELVGVPVPEGVDGRPIALE